MIIVEKHQKTKKTDITKNEKQLSFFLANFGFLYWKRRTSNAKMCLKRDKKNQIF